MLHRIDADSLPTHPPIDRANAGKTMPPIIRPPNPSIALALLRRRCRQRPSCGGSYCLPPAGIHNSNASSSISRPLSSSSSSSSSSVLLLQHPQHHRLQQLRRPLLPSSIPLLVRRGLASSGKGSKDDDKDSNSKPMPVAGVAAAHEEEAKGDDGVLEGHAHPLLDRPGLKDVPGVYYADRRLAIVYTCKVRRGVFTV